MDIEQQRKHKQDYLHQEILDKDYDGQEFADYCLDIKGNVDIDTWTFKDLVELVGSFIKAKQQKEKEDSNPFEGVFDKSKDVKGVEEFSSFGGLGSSQQNKGQDLNFEFIPDTKLNSLDLDFLSAAFLGTTVLPGPTSQPPKKIDPPPKQHILPTSNKAETAAKLEQPAKKWKDPQSRIQVPKEVANRLMLQNSKTIVSTQQPTNPQHPQAQTIALAPPNPTHPTSSTPPNPPVSPTTTPVSSKKVEQFFEKIPCKKVVARSLLLNSHAEMHISGHEIVTTNIFVPDHVVYHLMTVPLNIEVKRRFKDFETLRGILRKLFPSSRLPHLEKNSRLSETEPEVIKRQKYFLECFINDLLISAEFQNCRLVEEFLTMKDLDHLKKKFKEYDKEKIKGIEGLTSLNGEIAIRFTGKNLEYNDKVQNYIEVSEAYYQKIRQLYEQLVGNIQLCVKTLTDLSEVFSALQGVTKTFNSNVSVNQFPQLQRTYKYISQLNLQWSNSLKSQSKLIDSDIKTRFKFQKQNMGTLRQILRMRSGITQAYLKRADRQKCSQKYTSSKLEEYKVGVDYPSKHIVVLTYQNAYINDKTSSETERMFNELALKLRGEFSRFSKLQENVYNDMRGLWAGFSK